MRISKEFSKLLELETSKSNFRVSSDMGCFKNGAASSSPPIANVEKVEFLYEK
jgi:hypothetical protein